MAQRTVAPSELASDPGRPPRDLRVHPERSSIYAARLDLRHIGPDLEIDSFRPLSGLKENQAFAHPVTYLSSSRFAEALKGRSGLVVVTTPDLQSCVPAGNGLLLTNRDPRNAFYSVLESARSLGLFECLETYVGSSARISPSAVISSNVYVSDRVEVGPGVVILPNTYLGEGAVIKPNTVAGGDGFEATSGNERRIVAHAGGVWIEEGAQIGSCNCVDKGLFGDFTWVGAYTLTDNLVQIGHSARVGNFCSLTACAELSGSVVLDDGVWVGPNASINQRVHIAEHCYIGIGSVVIRDLKPFSLAYGSPAKHAAWVCECRAKISFQNGHADCGVCGKSYILADERVRRA